MEVAVCIITYQRPLGLRRLLDALNDLRFTGETPDVRCIVVDNDTQDAAREVCDEVRPGFRWRLDSCVEPARGIPQARNKAIRSAWDTADFIAFIDDDETPEPNWLDALLSAQREFGVGVVAGPVVTRYEGDVAPWIMKGEFLDLPRYPTGTRLPCAGTGNVLLAVDLLRSLHFLFDEKMALTGGSDSHFFKRLVRDGHEIVWADDAVTYEWTPASRATGRWILQRAYRNAVSRSLMEMDLDPCAGTSWRLVKAGVAWIVKAVVTIPVAWLFGRQRLMERVRQLVYGCGLLIGLLGVRYNEYRNVHGR